MMRYTERGHQSRETQNENARVLMELNDIFGGIIWIYRPQLAVEYLKKDRGEEYKR